MSKPQVRAYTGATLIDGTGARPVKDAVVLVKGDSIADAGSSVKVPKDAEVVNASGYTMLPGLIDSHVHITSNGEANMLAALNYSPGLVQLMGAANAAKTLEAGYTTIRDMGAPGGYALSLKQAIQMGIARGPRIIACGTVIGQTGGHADFYLPSGVTFAGLSRIADGPDDCRKAAREQLRSGSDFLKICTSGGVMSPTDPVDTPQFTLAEIRAIVEEASAVGKTVASHCHGPTGIINAIVAGVKTLEHGSIMTEESVRLAAEHDCFHVPTLAASWNIVKHGRDAGIPEYAVAKAEEIVKYPPRSMMMSHKAGVKVAAGTDAGTPFNRHGDNAKELELMVEAGLKPLEALVYSTKNGADALGILAKTGTLEKGKWADLILVEGDPLKDIKLLQDKARIRLVVKGGVTEVNRGL